MTKINKEKSNNYRQQTLAIRSGSERTELGEHSESLFLTSSYLFDNCLDASQKFSGEKYGSVYSRYTNPTVRNFELRLASLENSDDCIATSSGMAAILSLCMSHLRSGDHVLCSVDVFGSTINLLNNFISKFGIEIDYVNLTDIDDWKKSIKSNTKLFFIETPSNPLNEVGDIDSLSKLAHNNNCLLVVDNCFCTPALQQPINLGADIVIHSATKYLDGQGRCLGGALVGAKTLIDPIRSFIRAAGPTLSPFNAWVFLKGLETLDLRMRLHSENALNIAKWLEQSDKVEKVFYSGLISHKDHELAKKQQKDFGGVLSFYIKGDKKDAWRFIDATKLLSLTANLGDTKTTIIHPATTTHSRLSDSEKVKAGIKDNLIRIAVGLEHIDDIKDDLELGLETI